jgi:hypothetical protein
VTAEQQDKIQRHILAKIQDQEFRSRMEDAKQMLQLPAIEVVCRVICEQTGAVLTGHALETIMMCFAAGHVFGRDLGSVEGGGFPS